MRKSPRLQSPPQRVHRAAARDEMMQMIMETAAEGGPAAQAAPTAAGGDGGSGGGGSAAAASGSPMAGSSWRRRALLRWPRPRNMRLAVDQMYAVQILAMQCVNVWRNWGRAAAPAGQASTLLVLAAALVGALVPCAATGIYQRNRRVPGW